MMRFYRPRQSSGSLYAVSAGFAVNFVLESHSSLVYNAWMLPRALLLISLILATNLSAQELYRWLDDNGVPHYSTVKPEVDAKPAKLPEIAKAKFKLSDLDTAKSCSKHGGINCAAGSDQDGSVICYDGFKDASARFRFSCSSAKLVVSEILLPDQASNNQNSRNQKGQAIEGIKVFVRNSSSVVAKNSKAYLYLGGGKRTQLSGPTEIESFGIAEYTLPTTAEFPKLGHKLSSGNVTLSCLNCD